LVQFLCRVRTALRQERRPLCAAGRGRLPERAYASTGARAATAAPLAGRQDGQEEWARSHVSSAHGHYAKNVGPSALQGVGAFQSALMPPAPPGRAPQRRHRSPGGSRSTASTRRQDGQEECARSHVSTQAAWNAWPHCGSTRMACPSSNSARQMAHSSAPPPSSSPSALLLSETYVTVGSERSTSFLTPLLAALAPGCCDRPAAVAQRREHAHRATRPSPRTQTSAQSRPARMRIMSELMESSGEPDLAGASTSILAMGLQCTG